MSPGDLPAGVHLPLPLPFRILFLFVSSRGRIGRGLYWAGLGGLLFWSLFCLYLARRSFDETMPVIMTAGLIGLPSFCVMAKRLHDLGRTARVAALPGVLTAGLLLSAATPGVAPFAALLLAGGTGLCIGLLIVLGIMPGQEQDNRFGHAPGREIERTAQVFD